MTDKNKITTYCLKQIVWHTYMRHSVSETYGDDTAAKDYYQAVAYCDIVRTFNKQGHDLANKAIALGRKLFKNKDKIDPTFESIDNLPEMLEIYDSVKSLTNV